MKLSKPYFFRSKSLPFELRFSTDTHACYKKHTHEEFSIGIVDRGISEYFINNTRRQIGKGSIVFINPGEVHSCNPREGTSWSYKMLYISPSWLIQLYSDLTHESICDFEPIHTSLSESPVLYWEFQQMFSTLAANDASLATEQAAIVFFSRLYLKYKMFQPKDIYSKVAVDRAYQFISDNFDKNISIMDISKSCGMSNFYLIHSFKKQYGITPHAYQIVLRINKAKELLRKGEEITSVATDLGFTDQSHFHKSFKSMVAATPKQYKRNS